MSDFMFQGLVKEDRIYKTGQTGYSGKKPGIAIHSYSGEKWDVPSDLAGVWRKWGSDIDRMATKYQVDPALIASQVYAESSGDPKARAKRDVGARGLLQVRSAAANDVGFDNSRFEDNPIEGLEAGVKYLSGMLKKYEGNVRLAVGAYHSGAGNMDKALEATGRPYAGEENSKYTNKIMSMYGGIRKPPPDREIFLHHGGDGFARSSGGSTGLGVDGSMSLSSPSEIKTYMNELSGPGAGKPKGWYRDLEKKATTKFGYTGAVGSKEFWDGLSTDVSERQESKQFAGNKYTGSFLHGAAGSVTSLGTAVGLIGDKIGAGTGLLDASLAATSDLDDYFYVEDPNILTAIANGFGSSLPMLVGGGVGSLVARGVLKTAIGMRMSAMVAGSVGEGAAATQAVAQVASRTAMYQKVVKAIGVDIGFSVPEAMMEAGSTYAQGIDQGLSEEDAYKASQETMAANMGVLTLANIPLAFTDVWGARAGVKILATALAEGYGENLQSGISEAALGKRDWSDIWKPDHVSEMIVGATIGTVFGGVKIAFESAGAKTDPETEGDIDFTQGSPELAELDVLNEDKDPTSGKGIEERTRISQKLASTRKDGTPAVSNAKLDSLLGAVYARADDLATAVNEGTVIGKEDIAAEFERLNVYAQAITTEQSIRQVKDKLDGKGTDPEVTTDEQLKTYIENVMARQKKTGDTTSRDMHEVMVGVNVLARRGAVDEKYMETVAAAFPIFQPTLQAYRKAASIQEADIKTGKIAKPVVEAGSKPEAQDKPSEQSIGKITNEISSLESQIQEDLVRRDAASPENKKDYDKAIGEHRTRIKTLRSVLRSADVKAATEAKKEPAKQAEPGRAPEATKVATPVSVSASVDGKGKPTGYDWAAADGSTGTVLISDFKTGLTGSSAEQAYSEAKRLADAKTEEQDVDFSDKIPNTEAEKVDVPDNDSARVAESLALRLGVKINWMSFRHLDDGRRRSNGWYRPSKNSEIFINIDSNNPFVGVALHESLHFMKTNHPAEWQSILDTVKEQLGEDGTQAANDVLSDAGYLTGKLDGELVSFAGTKAAQNDSFWKKLAAKDRSAFSILSERILGILKQAREMVVGDSDSNANTVFGDSIKNMGKVEDAIAAAVSSVADKGLAAKKPTPDPTSKLDEGKTRINDAVKRRDLGKPTKTVSKRQARVAIRDLKVKQKEDQARGKFTEDNKTESEAKIQAYEDIVLSEGTISDEDIKRVETDAAKKDWGTIDEKEGTPELGEDGETKVNLYEPGIEETSEAALREQEIMDKEHVDYLNNSGARRLIVQLRKSTGKKMPMSVLNDGTVPFVHGGDGHTRMYPMDSIIEAFGLNAIEGPKTKADAEALASAEANAAYTRRTATLRDAEARLEAATNQALLYRNQLEEAGDVEFLDSIDEFMDTTDPGPDIGADLSLGSSRDPNVVFKTREAMLGAIGEMNRLTETMSALTKEIKTIAKKTDPGETALDKKMRLQKELRDVAKKIDEIGGRVEGVKMGPEERKIQYGSFNALKGRMIEVANELRLLEGGDVVLGFMGAVHRFASAARVKGLVSAVKNFTPEKNRTFPVNKITNDEFLQRHYERQTDLRTLEKMEDGSLRARAHRHYRNWFDPLHMVKVTVDDFFGPSASDKLIRRGLSFYHTLRTTMTGSSAVFNEYVQRGPVSMFRFDDDGKRVRFYEKGIKQILDDHGISTNEATYERFNEYMRAVGVNWVVENKPNALHGKAEEIAEFKAEWKKVEEAYQNEPGFKEAVDELTQFSNGMLQVLEEAGVLKPGEREAVINKRTIYAPLHESIEDMKAGAGKDANVNSSKGIKAATRIDMNTKFVRPVEAMIRNTARYTSIAASNHSKRVLGKLVALAKDDQFGEVISFAQATARNKQRSLTTGFEGKFRDEVKLALTSKIGGASQELGLSPETIEGIVDEIMNPTNKMSNEARAARVWVSGTELGPDMISYFDNGEFKVMRVNGGLMEGFAHYRKEELGLINKVGAKMTKVLKTGATSTPEFALSNIIRDFASAVVGAGEMITSPQAALEFAGQWGHALKSVMTNDENFTNFTMAGAGLSDIHSMDRDEINTRTKQMMAKGNAKRVLIENPSQALPVLLDITRDILSKGESITRLAVFQQRLTQLNKSDPGISNFVAAQIAAMDSRDATIDFARIGTQAAHINRFVPFFSASMSGTDKIVRSLLSPSAKDRTGTLMRGFVSLTLPSLALYAHNKDEEWYQEAPLWEKNLFWLFKVGDVVVRIPKPFEYGLIFASLPERMAEYAENQDSFTMDNLKGLLLQQSYAGISGLSPLTSAFPPITSLLAARANYDSFRQEKIVKGVREDLAAPFQYTANTSEFSRALSMFLYDTSDGDVGLSPAKMDFWIRGTFGGLGKYATKILDNFIPDEDPTLSTWYHEIPLARRFVRDEQTPYGRYSNEFYEFLEAARKSKVTRNYLLKTKKDKEAVINEVDKNGQWVAMYPTLYRVSEITKSLTMSAEAIKFDGGLTDDLKRSKIKTIHARREQAYRIGVEHVLKNLPELTKASQAVAKRLRRSLEKEEKNKGRGLLGK